MKRLSGILHTFLRGVGRDEREESMCLGLNQMRNDHDIGAWCDKDRIKREGIAG